jgi:hypothetical protein
MSELTLVICQRECRKVWLGKGLKIRFALPLGSLAAYTAHQLANEVMRKSSRSKGHKIVRVEGKRVIVVAHGRRSGEEGDRSMSCSRWFEEIFVTTCLFPTIVPTLSTSAAHLLLRLMHVEHERTNQMA